VFSPGKALAFADGHKKTTLDVAHFLPYAKEAMEHGVNWVTNPAVLLYSLCLPFFLWPSKASGDRRKYLPPRWLALGGLGGMCFLMLEFASAEMASGYGQFPPRTVGWAQFVFWLLFVCVILIGLPEISQMNFSQGSRIGMLMLLMASLLGSGNFRSAEKDLRGPAPSYWRSSVARLRERGSSLEFDPLPTKPALFRGTNLATNPKCWVNQTMALYLGANTVIAKDPHENTAFVTGFAADRCGVAGP
jgi:hypothetical protein